MLLILMIGGTCFLVFIMLLPIAIIVRRRQRERMRPTQTFFPAMYWYNQYLNGKITLEQWRKMRVKPVTTYVEFAKSQTNHNKEEE